MRKTKTDFGRRLCLRKAAAPEKVPQASVTRLEIRPQIR
jgi:hypothetical protein